ncbi:hypothetical protein SRHO_G00091390 [Serrasalmus rhombeus]
MLHSLGRGCAPQTGFTHASQTPSWPPIVAEAQPAALTQPAEPVGLGPGAEQSRGLAWSSRLLWREKRAGKLSLDPPVSGGAAPSSPALYNEEEAENDWVKSREACQNLNSSARTFTTSSVKFVWTECSPAHTDCWIFAALQTHASPSNTQVETTSVKRQYRWIV